MGDGKERLTLQQSKLRSPIHTNLGAIGKAEVTWSGIPSLDRWES